MKKKSPQVQKTTEKKTRKNPIPDVIIKISDLKLILAKMESLGVSEFKVKTSKGDDPEQSNLYFYFFSRDFISFVHYRDYEGFGRVIISYCEGPDIQHDNELLDEKRALLAYVDDEDIFQY